MLPEPNLQFVDVLAPAEIIPSSARIANGKIFPPQQQILLFSPDEWEEFIKEWVHYQKTKYVKVVRLAGAGDLGVDVAGLTSKAAFEGEWDCYQCKHYDNPLTPSIALPEIGKILWHSFQKKYTPPKKYYFIAPWGCGPKLKKYLLKPSDLKNSVITGWDENCADAITSTATIKLEGDFRAYAESFDYSVFTFKTALEIIDEHRNTPYYAYRFGGGLPGRPPAPTPPHTIQPTESRYIKKLYEVYSEECGTTVNTNNDLKDPHLSQHLDRQRELFYSAEALRNFARDTVPPGTFEDLQSEVYSGIIDIEQARHESSLVRVNTVTQAAANLPITANGLISVTKIQDKKGICHQLANDDRLQWKKDNKSV